MFRVVVLDGLLGSITTYDHSGLRAYLNPPPLCQEGVRTVGTTEAMVRFAVLKKC